MRSDSYLYRKDYMDKFKKNMNNNKCNKDKFVDKYCYICDTVHLA